jgi:HSP20 family protein
MMHWDPFAELNRIQQLSRRNENAERAMRPLVDIREDETSFVVQAELPGTKPEDVHVEVERGVLTIRGERRFSSDENVQKQYRRVERYYGAFERSFSLPSEVDADSVNAQLTNGVLEVRIPKKTAPSPKRVTVTVS